MMSDDVERRVSTARSSLPVPTPTPRELAAFVPYALEVLQATFKVRVHCVIQEDEYVHTRKPHTVHISKSVTINLMPKTSENSPVAASTVLLPVDESTSELELTAVNDSHGHVVEVALCRMQVPCVLLRLVILCAPFHTLLSRVTLHFCRLDALALNQLIHLLTGTQVSELSLNDSRLSSGGFHLLLEMESQLRWLSLDRCSLGDDGAVKLAVTLQHPLPASVSLKALSLACNGIGDTGARAFAEALRSNRQLQYLNLSDNCVTDAGAIPLLKCLCEFPLSYEEVIEARRRLLTRLRLKQELYTRIYAELLGNSARHLDSPASVARGRKPVCETVAAKAEAMVEEQLGLFLEPFGVAEITERGNVSYCAGNTILCWLNLGYNSLGYASLAELAHVMAMQASMSSGTSSRLMLGQGRGPGLVRVVVEGNPLPHACVELAAVTARIETVLEVLERAASRPARKTAPRRK